MKAFKIIHMSNTMEYCNEPAFACFFVSFVLDSESNPARPVTDLMSDDLRIGKEWKSEAPNHQGSSAQQHEKRFVGDI